MNIHDATEVAYKNGYKAGYQAGVKAVTERLKTYFNDGKDVMYMQTIIHYAIDKFEKELAGDPDDR